MDDFILIHKDKEYLKYCLKVIMDKLYKLKLKLNMKKTKIYKLSQPTKFLGFSYRVVNGKIIMKIISQKFYNYKQKIKGIMKRVTKGFMTWKHFYQCIQSWKAYACKGNTHSLILKLDNYIKERKKLCQEFI